MPLKNSDEFEIHTKKTWEVWHTKSDPGGYIKERKAYQLSKTSTGWRIVIHDSEYKDISSVFIPNEVVDIMKKEETKDSLKQ